MVAYQIICAVFWTIKLTNEGMGEAILDQNNVSHFFLWFFPTNRLNSGPKTTHTAAFSGLLLIPPTDVLIYSPFVPGCLQFVLSASIRAQACI
jgi:hypothetical protein